MKVTFIILFTIIFTCKLFAQQSINEVVYFDYGKYELTVNAKNILDSCYNKIKDADFRQISIIGHTDTDGSDAYNMTLSENRSRTVLNYFLSKGISENKIKIQFYGEKKPIAKNDSDQYKQQNRRVEIVIEQGNSENILQFDKQAETFLIAADRDTTLNCAEGTIIKIKANSFVFEINGIPITGIVKFSVKEFYKISDIILSNLATTSDGQLLETGGMVHISATVNEEKLKLKKGQTIEINFPTKQKVDNMQLFSGEWENENHINWTVQAPTQEEVYIIVEENPRFIGGDIKLYQFISSNLNYPEQAEDLGIQGTVYVTFIISETGEVQDARVVRGLTAEMDSAALAVLYEMPRWIPGKRGGQNVKVQKTLPIRFSIGDPIFTDEGDFSEKFEQAFTDTTMNKATSSDIAFYLLNSSEIGWINCDRFIDVSPKINYAIKFTEDIDNVKIIFNRYKAIMDGRPTNINKVYTLRGVPPGEEITIVAVKRIGKKPYLAVKQTKTSSKVEEDLTFQAVTMEMLKAEIRKLDGLD